MQFLDYDIPIGVSLNHEFHLQLVDDYVAHGFTHFEYQLPVSRDGSRDSTEAVLNRVLPLNHKLAEHNLRPWSVHLPFMPSWDVADSDPVERLFVSDAMKDIIRHVAPWGVQVVTMHACVEPVAAEDRPIRLLHAAQTIRELRDFAAPLGMRIAVENLPRACLGNTSTELVGIIGAVPGVGCCFDVNHLLYEDHRGFMEHLARHVITTHLSDYDGIDERHWVPGKGIVPFRLILETLQKSGYRGPYLFELNLNDERKGFTGQEILDGFRKKLQM